MGVNMDMGVMMEMGVFRETIMEMKGTIGMKVILELDVKRITGGMTIKTGKTSLRGGISVLAVHGGQEGVSEEVPEEALGVEAEVS